MSDVAIVLGGTFLLCLLTGVPILVTLGVATVAGLLVADFDLIVLAQRMVSGTQVFSLLAIPGFILAGDLMMRGGLSRRLVAICQALVGHVTGGLGMVTVLSATFFAAISGSAPATTAAIGGTMIPEMQKAGWNKGFSAALATAAGPIGQMIPPSIPMVVWAVLSQESVTKLFIAGVVPGLLMALGFLLVCYVHARRSGLARQSRRATLRELRNSLREGALALLAPVVILGGIYGGAFTPTEASAIGVLYALIVGVFVYREIRPRDLPGILLSSARTTAIVCSVIAIASAFGWIVAIEQLPQQLADAVFTLTENRIVILLSLNVLLLVVGAVMDNVAAMIILGGVLTSIGTQLGIDPTQLGALIVINFAVGMATPPFGYSLFVGASISGLSIEQITRHLWPFFLVQIAVLLAVSFIPAVTLGLVRLIGA